MQGQAGACELSAPPTLQAVLQLLAEEPGAHTLMAGGTELMVAFNSGRLEQRSFLSIRHLPELRFIRAEPDAIHIGAATTFTDLRRHSEIAHALPLLARVASWTGSLANQNRGTLGGNLCNASPAADSPPALLVYDATVTLASAAGSRTLPYSDFHLGYKRTALRPDELLHTISIPRLPETGTATRQYIRKVGTRNAQAISKVALAATGTLEHGVLVDIRLAAASLAEQPLRLTSVEASLRARSVGPADLDATIRAGRAALALQARPIDDIRSTAKYRAAVAANLLEEFLRSCAEESSAPGEVLPPL